MAAANSLDDILNCAVDESAISALVGSLETQLASPTSKDPAPQSSVTSVHHNHIGVVSTGSPSSVSVSGVSLSQLTQASTHGHALPANLISKQPPPSTVHIPAVINSVNGSKEHTSQSQFLGINSVVSSVAGINRSIVNSPGTQHLNVPIQTTSGLANSVTIGGGVLPRPSTVVTNVLKSEPDLKPVVVPAGSATNAGAVAYGVQTTGVSSVVSTLAPNVQSASGSAIYNLANVAAEQRRMMVPGSNIVQAAPTVQPKVELQPNQLDIKPPHTQVLVNVVNAPTSVPQQRPQFVLKSEKNGVAGMQQAPGAVRFVTQPTQPQQAVASSAQHVQMIPQNVVTTSLKSGAVTSVTTSVITITRPAAPQTVTVLRAPTSTVPGTPQAAMSSSQIQFVNVPRVSHIGGTNVGPRALAPRVISQGPIRIAQQPQMIPVRPPGVQGMQLQAGMAGPTTVLMKNAQGQLMLVQQNPQQQGAVTTVPSAVSGQPYKMVKVAGGVPQQGTIASAIPSTHMQPLAIQPQQTMATMGAQQTMVTVSNTSLASMTHAHPTAIATAAQMPASAHVPGATAAHLVANQGIQENVRKCKNFLSTLIKLASNQPQDTVRNVKDLIQGLVDGKVEPELFTAKLQVELKSSPQPYLVPFLKKSLPSLRQSLGMNRMQIEGVRPPPQDVFRAAVSQVMASTVSAASAATMPHPNIPTPVSQLQAQELAKKSRNLQSVRPVASAIPNMVYQPRLHMPISNANMGPANQTKTLLSKPAGALLPGALAQVAAIKQAHAAKMPISKAQASGSPAAASGSMHRDKRKYDSLKEDDDINDVAAMGGVNLSEETKNILATNSELMGGQLRSCKDENFLHSKALMSRITCMAQKHGIDHIPQDVVNLISHATQERLRNVVEKLANIAEHRLEIYKTDQRYEVTNEVKPQIKFLEELDKLEKKQHADAERTVLLRAARSRSKHEDPEQLKLKEKARALQQQEAEVARQKEANVTALAAIGPWKKRKPDPESPAPGTPGSSSMSGASATRQNRPARRKRVCLRDLVFLLEQERETTKSQTLYKAHLK